MKNMKNEKHKVLGNFIIQETLGKGTFGKVKLGVYIPTKEKVAVKILEKSKLRERDDYERVMREMEILKIINHDNIVQIFEILEDSEKYYIIMEYCEDGELFNYIVKKKRLSDEETSYFYYQLINGLESIHSCSVVHRDLKPENLLINKDKRLKIIDFGLSNFFNKDSSLLVTPCGSPCYASPEMVAGNKYNGFMIDVWSTGIILFAMICGYLPFEDPENEKLFVKILDCNLQFPSHVSSTVKDLIKKILVRNPDQRIKINEIKLHPFYLQGKSVYEKSFPRLSKNNIPTPNILVQNLKTTPGEDTNKKNKKKIHVVYDSVTPGLNFNNFISSSLSPKKILIDPYKYEVLNTVGNTNIVSSTNTNFFNINDNHADIKARFKNSNNILVKKPISSLNVHEILFKNGVRSYKDEYTNTNLTTNNVQDHGKKIQHNLKNISPLKENFHSGKSTRNNKKDFVSFNHFDFNMNNASNKNPLTKKNVNVYDLNFSIKSITKKLKESNMNSVNKYLPTINRLKLDKKSNKVEHTEPTSAHNVVPLNAQNSSKINNLYLFTDGNEPSENNKRKMNELFNSTLNSKFKLNTNSNKIKTSKLNVAPSTKVTPGSLQNAAKNKLFNTSFAKIKEKVKDLYYKDYLTRIGVQSGTH